ncbi:hypothetical protein TEA_006989 [Camellia sinensis var. sinensis]|uniref:Uncharacterized protein n=1 Tax=Camellia sinensis var. sinensis TaxID=542762 RepID=A0A4S4EA33_CAMSN|nr:hypothetical protein TEA_006989 [Camellia sinensis var. sinensis]
MTAGGARLLDRRSSKKIICDAAAAGATAGAIAATFVCPLDVIKTRLQVHGLPEAHSVQKCSLLAYGYTVEEFLVPTKESACVKKHDVVPILVMSLQNRGKAISVFLVSSSHCGKTTILKATSLVYFTVYGYLKDLLHTHGCSYCDNTVNNSGQLTFGANMIAASGAGAVTVIAANPLWVVKARLQVAKEILNPLVKCTVTGGAFDQVRLGETVKETEGVLGRVQLKKQALNSIPLLLQTEIEFWNCFAAIYSAQPTMRTSDVGVRYLDMPKFSTLEGLWTVLE